MTPVEFDPTEGVWARVASEDVAVLVARPITNDRLRKHFAERNMRDAMVAPLHGEGTVIGTMTVGNRLGEVTTFNSEDLKLFETLANHASVSVQNARLIEQLEESLAHLTEMNRLKDDFVAAVSTTPDTADIDPGLRQDPAAAERRVACRSAEGLHGNDRPAGRPASRS